MAEAREQFEEVRKQIDDLCRKIKRAEGRISRTLAEIRFLEDHSCLPGAYLVFLDESGYFAALRNLGLPDRKNCSQALRGLEMLARMNGILCWHRGNLLRSCGSVDESWGPLSDKWNFLLQEAESLKEGRMAFEKYSEEIRPSAEALPAEVSGPIEELVRSIKSGEIAIGDDWEGVREECRAIEERSRELRSEIAPWEEELAAWREEYEKLFTTLREMDSRLQQERQKGS